PGIGQEAGLCLRSDADEGMSGLWRGTDDRGRGVSAVGDRTATSRRERVACDLGHLVIAWLRRGLSRCGDNHPRCVAGGFPVLRADRRRKPGVKTEETETNGREFRTRHPNPEPTRADRMPRSGMC